MKKTFITLLFLIPFLTGCASVNTNLTINKNKSAVVTVNLKTDKKASSKDLSTIKSNYKKFLDKNYKITNNSTKKTFKYKAVKTVKNLKKEDINLSSLGFNTKLKSGRYVDIKHNFFVTSYNINMVYDLRAQVTKIKKAKKNAKTSNAGLTPEYFQKYADKDLVVDNSINQRADIAENFESNVISQKEASEDADNAQADKKVQKPHDNLSDFGAKFSVTLPMPASYNNADDSKDNTYYWNIKKDEPTEIKLQYVVYGGFAITFILLVGVLLLVYLARRIWRHDTLKRIGNNN
ncbi:MAG TPA: hypothetical protein DEO94_02565 [Cyanobacteria bacterium UBA11991]|nr:hypothetical protein [Cyanobacteriota bacterium]MDY6358011.1 hypothetical protein [Cyanobacteriota bacterium]MDY6364289.1 hypothetical protein [Cyanobacteriota bacterium]HCB11029.1 hypothetical protein [Cyanobacteria bacterium UBA11991]